MSTRSWEITGKAIEPNSSTQGSVGTGVSDTTLMAFLYELAPVALEAFIPGDVGDHLSNTITILEIDYFVNNQVCRRFEPATINLRLAAVI
jgi:hypothetical protein